MDVGIDPDTGEGIALADVLADDAEDPAEAAARNLDWEALMESLDALERRMIVAFARGDSMRSVKYAVGLSDSGMSGRKRRLIAAFARGETMRSLKKDAGLSDSCLSGKKRKLAAVMLEFFGPECLEDAGRLPEWMADVLVQREHDACRHGA